jgi:hypothetical protein
MVKEIPEITTVHASTGMDDGMSDAGHGGGMSPSFPGETSSDGDDEGPQAPF